MRAILMAAGMGTRISEKTNEPKSLLSLGEETLLEHTVKLLLKNNIEVSIVLGFKGELIREKLKTYPITFYENPFYRVTNSIASTWFVKDQLYGDEDIIFANADVFWQQDILDILLQSNEDVLMLADSSRRLTGDYFFNCEENCLVGYGKDMAVEKRTSEYVGIAVLRKSIIPAFRKRMIELVGDGEYNFWWENTLYTMITERDIYVKDIAGHYWSEIDVIEDYESILKYIKENKKN